jgi:hypothetical protein
MPPGELAALDNWIKAQPHRLSRPEALRRLALATLAGAPIKQVKGAAGENRPASPRQRALVCNQE